MTSAQKQLRSREALEKPDLPGTPAWKKIHAQDATLSQIISDDYPHFQPCIYSLDVILPIIDLGQEEYWMPNHNKSLGKKAYYFAILLKLSGWTLSTLLISALTGLIRR